MGRAADVYNRKLIVFYGLVIWNVATICLGLSNNFVELLLSRILLGIGESFSMPASYSLIADYFPAESLGQVCITPVCISRRSINNKAETPCELRRLSRRVGTLVLDSVREGSVRCVCLIEPGGGRFLVFVSASYDAAVVCSSSYRPTSSSLRFC